MAKNTYKKLRGEFGAWIDTGYGRDNQPDPQAGDVVIITTKAGEDHTRTVKSTVKAYASGCVVTLVHDEAVAKTAQQRYTAKSDVNRVAPLSSASTLSNAEKARVYDDINNEGGEGFNPYR